MGSGYTRVPFGLVVVRPGRVPIERFRVQTQLSHTAVGKSDDENSYECIQEEFLRPEEISGLAEIYE
eukprot:1192769-Prorocentrum_minimum.AAC.2